MATQPADPNIIPVSGRFSYLHVFEAKTAPGSDKAKFSGTFLMDEKRDAAAIKRIEDRIKVLLNEPPLKGTKLAADRICLKDGMLKDGTEGYGKGIKFLSASSDKRPTVVNRDNTPLTAQDGKPYSGAYGDGSVRLWVQDNKFGKRINAELRVVRFLKDGEPFGGGVPVDADAELPDVDEVEV